MSEPANTFSKEERLCGKASVSALISDGRWGTTAHFRYCWRKSREDGLNRIIASVPKKYFKRAVKRNLLKRRIREAYRTHKAAPMGIDVMFSYWGKEIADFNVICAEIESILARISKTAQQP